MIRPTRARAPWLRRSQRPRSSSPPAAAAATTTAPVTRTPASESEIAGRPRVTAPCTLGTLLPQTGDLAFLGPPEFAGVDLAVEEINAAGGVLGKDVVNVKADSGDGTPDIAGAEVDKLLQRRTPTPSSAPPPPVCP